ncbi:hypothetical protein [Bradyrhizobium sp. HKCCYLS20291]|uniref:hypothetical protein n=1 Tax=Bradyrhizobium sp. HKCCYLS20291 TaxID=3420766 RepID=UPI003EBB8E3E
MIENLGESSRALTRETLMEILTTASAASLAGDKREVVLDGLTMRFDGRPKRNAVIFDEHPWSWLWKPELISSAATPTLDYVWVEIRTPSATARAPIATAKLIAASRDFLSHERAKPAATISRSEPTTASPGPSNGHRPSCVRDAAAPDLSGMTAGFAARRSPS